MASLSQRRKELLDSMMRDAVYDGAVAVLTQHGLNGTTMDRVAEAAGMAKGSLYNRFRSKQELLEFVHERAVAPMREALAEIVQDDMGAADKLLAISRIWREYLGQHRAVFEFLISDLAAHRLLRDTAQTSRASAIDDIAAIVEQGIREGVFRPVDARAVAEMFISASIGMVEQEFARGQPRSIDQAVEVLLGVFLRGLSVVRQTCESPELRREIDER
jgi:AcrR family transcriptional regulator